MSTVSVTLDVPACAVEGSIVLARVHAALTDPVRVRGGEVTLVRSTSLRYRQVLEGGGTHPATVRRVEDVHREVLPPGAPDGAYDVEALLPVPPDGPASADTALVQVDWAVRARLDVGGERIPQAVRRLAVTSFARACASEQDRPPRADARGHTAVAVEHLSSRRIVPGARLTGDVLVTPLEVGTIRAVRLELVLVEAVRLGTDAPVGTKEASTVVASAEPATQLLVEDDLAPRRLPFALEVPAALPAPSTVTPEYELAWLLRAVAARRLHRDAYVELGLQAATVPG